MNHSVHTPTTTPVTLFPLQQPVLLSSSSIPTNNNNNLFTSQTLILAVAVVVAALIVILNPRHQTKRNVTQQLIKKGNVTQQQLHRIQKGKNFVMILNKLFKDFKDGGVSFTLHNGNGTGESGKKIKIAVMYPSITEMKKKKYFKKAFTEYFKHLKKQKNITTDLTTDLKLYQCYLEKDRNETHYCILSPFPEISIDEGDEGAHSNSLSISFVDTPPPDL